MFLKFYYWLYNKSHDNFCELYVIWHPFIQCWCAYDICFKHSIINSIKQYEIIFIRKFYIHRYFKGYLQFLFSSPVLFYVILPVVLYCLYFSLDCFFIIRNLSLFISLYMPWRLHNVKQTVILIYYMLVLFECITLYHLWTTLE